MVAATIMKSLQLLLPILPVVIHLVFAPAPNVLHLVHEPFLLPSHDCPTGVLGRLSVLHLFALVLHPFARIFPGEVRTLLHPVDVGEVVDDHLPHLKPVVVVQVEHVLKSFLPP